jgi:hypothetical protein
MAVLFAPNRFASLGVIQIEGLSVFRRTPYNSLYLVCFAALNQVERTNRLIIADSQNGSCK